MDFFVYGTLKSNHPQHQLFFGNHTETRAAWLYGRLYHLPEGYPTLEIPESHILAEAGLSFEDDLRITREHQHGIAPPSHNPPGGDWDKVYGQWTTLDNPAKRLPRLDEYEDFVPGCGGLYRRVLSWVFIDNSFRLSWLYIHVGPTRGRRLQRGSWHADHLA